MFGTLLPLAYVHSFLSQSFSSFTFRKFLWLHILSLSNGSSVISTVSYFFPTNPFIFNVDFTFSITIFFLSLCCNFILVGEFTYSNYLFLKIITLIDDWEATQLDNCLLCCLGSDQSTTGLEINAATGHRSGCASVI